MPDGSTYYIIIMIVLVALSAFFSASETAYTSFNRTKMKNLAAEGNKRAAAAMKLAEKYTSHEEVVAVIENAFGKELTFDTCAKSSEMMHRIRESVNELIKKHC